MGSFPIGRVHLLSDEDTSVDNPRESEWLNGLKTGNGQSYRTGNREVIFMAL